MKLKRRRQRRMKGITRDPLLSCVTPAIRREIQRCADKHKVFPSFVVANILADAMGVELEDIDRFDYED